MGADLIKGPVGRIVGLIVWLAVFNLILGSVNQWYLQADDAGLVGSERLDRVVYKSTAKADDDWKDVTGTGDADATKVATGDTAPTYSTTTAFILTEGTSATCKIGDVAAKATPAATDKGYAAAEFYSPAGTLLKSPATPVSADGEEQTITGCKWDEGSSVFQSGGLSGLIRIILQSAGLAPPIALMFVLGTFGQSFIRNLGGHPILAAVAVVILLLLLATLFNTLVPFLTTAFEGIDGNRYKMFSEGIGAVSTIVGDFFGVVLVASVLMVAWSAIQHMRGGNTLTSSSRM